MGRITEGGLGDGESSGLPSLQAIHEAYEGEACEAPSQLLRIRGMVQETHTHLDEHKVATQGSHRIGQVRQQVSEWGHGSAWKVEAQVRDSTAELASSEWAREGVHEVGSPSWGGLLGRLYHTHQGLLKHILAQKHGIYWNTGR